MRICVHITSRDRHSEIALCLQSLRDQTFNEWDVIILDDASGVSVMNCYFVASIINRARLEGHRVKMLRNEHSQGVCAARNKLIEEDDFGNELVFRCDDDVILEPNYLEKLVDSINQGYDAVCGVVPYIAQPEFVRETKFVKPIINEHRLDEEGNITMRKDECAFCYDTDETILTHQFRTNLLYKKAITDSGIRYPKTLSFTGFREELWFSFQAITKGYKIGVRTGAKAWHLLCQSGGCKSADYAQRVQLDEETTNRWVRDLYLKHGNFLKKYYEANT